MAYGSILGQTPTASNVLYNNSQTSSVITGNTVQQAIDQLSNNIINSFSAIKINSWSITHTIGTEQNISIDLRSLNLDITKKYFFELNMEPDNDTYGTIEITITPFSSLPYSSNGVEFYANTLSFSTGTFTHDSGLATKIFLNSRVTNRIMNLSYSQSVVSTNPNQNKTVSNYTLSWIDSSAMYFLSGMTAYSLTTPNYTLGFNINFDFNCAGIYTLNLYQCM